MATCLLLQGFPVLMLFWADSPWQFFLFSAIFGLGFGGEWTGYLVINRQYYGNGPMGALYGWQNTGSLLAHAFVSWAAGMMVALTNSYTAILMFSLATSLGGAVMVAALEPTSQRLIPANWEEDLPAEARSRPRRRQWRMISLPKGRGGQTFVAFQGILGHSNGILAEFQWHFRTIPVSL